MSKPRIIIVGAAWYGDWAKRFYKAFERLGFESEIVYNNSAPSTLGGNTDSVTHVFERLKRIVRRWVPGLFDVLKKVRVRMSEAELLARVGNPGNTREVLVIFVWTPGSMRILSALRKRSGVKLVLWLGETPLRDASWEPTFDLFDEVFMVDHHEWTATLSPKNQSRVKLLPLSSDETVFFPLSNATPEYVGEVAFVGQYIPPRAEILGCLRDFDIRIYGYGWEEGFEQFPWLREKYKGSIATPLLNEVYNGAKVVIGTLGSPNDPFTTSTMRTFDIALAGSFQICEPVALTEEIFGDSVKFFESKDDLLKLVDYYLKHESKREELAEKAHRISISHSYTARARQILTECGLERWIEHN